MKKVAVFIIAIYQKTLSPDHGPLRHVFPHGYCKYHPTCSEYSKRAIEKYGLIKGSFKGCKRILRCNPCSKGGVDEL